MRKRHFKLTPPDPSEDQFQHSIADLLDRILPEEQVAWTHFPAGGYELSPAARARLYRLGLKRGWPDILICYEPCRSLWLEVKTATGHLSPAQRSMHLRLQAMGHPVVVVRRVEDVIKALMEYSVPFRRVRLAEAYGGQTVTTEAPGAAAEYAQGRSGISSGTAQQEVDWTLVGT